MQFQYKLVFFNFYSRPCGRGDVSLDYIHIIPYQFLLTPLREGRPGHTWREKRCGSFLLTPLREGRQQFSTSPS